LSKIWANLIKFGQNQNLASPQKIQSPTAMPKCLSFLVSVVLPDPFRGMGAWRNYTETQQLGYAPEVKNGRSRTNDGAPERLRCGTIQEEVS